jgi:arylsulfatase A-like enzyme
LIKQRINKNDPIAGHIVRNEIVLNIDIAPTIYEIVTGNTMLPSSMDGMSLVPLLTSSHGSGRSRSKNSRQQQQDEIAENSMSVNTNHQFFAKNANGGSNFNAEKPAELAWQRRTNFFDFL